MSRRKPRGLNGPLLLTSGRAPQFLTNELPPNKAAIESKILDLALNAAQFKKLDLYGLTASPVQNGENDFDFTLPTRSGVEYLDLVEVVLKGGYEGAPTSIVVGVMADQMFALVKGKAKKYGLRRRSVVHLLLYSTHWKFLPSDSVIALLSLYCCRKQHGFKSVAVTMPIMDEAAVLWVCHRAGDVPTMSASDERALRQNVLHQFSPLASAPLLDGGVGWRIPG